MAVRDPKTLRSGAQRPVIDGIVDALRGLYTFTTGNEYLALGAALQITTAPAGTPVANTLYKDNICKAWINFKGTVTVAINDSFNVSGVVRNSLGNYTVTWDRDFADINYAVAGFLSNEAVSNRIIDGSGTAPLAVGSMSFNCTTLAGAAVDSTVITVRAIGNQT